MFPIANRVKSTQNHKTHPNSTALFGNIRVHVDPSHRSCFKPVISGSFQKNCPLHSLRSASPPARLSSKIPGKASASVCIFWPRSRESNCLAARQQQGRKPTALGQEHKHFLITMAIRVQIPQPAKGTPAPGSLATAATKNPPQVFQGRGILSRFSLRPPENLPLFCTLVGEGCGAP